MSPNRAFRESRERFLHVSAPLIPNPARQIEIALKGHSILPEIVVGHRTTYFQKRNQAKREHMVRQAWNDDSKYVRLARPVVRCTKKVTP